MLNGLGAVGEPVQGGEVDGLRTVPAVAEAAVEGAWEGHDELARLLHRVHYMHACAGHNDLEFEP